MEPFSKVVKMDIDTLVWPVSYYRRAGRRVDVYRYGRGQSRCYLVIEGLDPRSSPEQSFLATFETDEKGLFVHLTPLFGAERLVEPVSLHSQIQETRRSNGLICSRGRRTRVAPISSLAHRDEAVQVVA